MTIANLFQLEGNPKVSGDKAAAAPTPGQTNPPHRILVVDDDISIRQLITRMLIRHGYHVDAAENGAVAWDSLQLNSYDLLVTDHSMPKVSGLELLNKMRAARVALPVILASGAMSAEELNRHPRLQLAATLPKPFTGDQLLGTVKQVLRTTDDAREQIAPPNWQSQPSTAGLQL
jgi:DNA-binding NtrC family response regulator